MILRTERAETFQPAPARVRAIASSPPKPERAMRSIVARTASAKRRTGGTGFTVEPTVLARGSARALPVRDGVRADEEDAGGEVTRPAEEAPDLEGAEALRRRVVGSLPLRDLPEASGEELDDLPGEAGVELRLLEPRLHAGERVVQVSELAEVSSCGEAEEPRGGQDGPQCEALGGLVDLAPELAADGRAESVGSVGDGSRLGACVLMAGDASFAQVMGIRASST